jgi:hypothetical protein
MRTIIGAVMVTALVLAPVSAGAKEKKKVTGLELQQVQARDFEVPKGTTFSAVMSVLQDEGYRIGSADKDTGLITAMASTESKMTWLPFVGFGKKKRTPIVSAYIEDRGPAITRVRLNFVMGRYNANQYGADQGERPITDPVVYKEAFEKIEQAIFVRQAMDAAPPPVKPVEATPAVATQDAQPAPVATAASAEPQ